MFNNVEKIILLAFFSTLLIGCGESANSNSIESNPQNSYETPAIELSSKEQQRLNILSSNQERLLEAINQERSQRHSCGEKGVFEPVHALTWNVYLYASALEHATDLATSNTFSHDGSGTSSDITGDGEPSKFYERIVANGYSNYYSVGENIAGGQRSLEEVMKDWMKSPGHCANIMSPKYTEVGVAIVINEKSKYKVYWAQNFGSKHI